MATSAEPQSPQQHVFDNSPPSIRSSRSNSPVRGGMQHKHAGRGAPDNDGQNNKRSSSQHANERRAPFKSLSEMEEYLKTEVAYIDYTAKSSDLLEDGLAVVRMLFGWSADDVQLEQCKDGITNKLVRAKYVPKINRNEENAPPTNCSVSKLAPGSSVLVRIYGKKSEVLIDRKTELLNMLGLSKINLAPPIYGRFNNGLVYGFVAGEVFKVSDMADAHKSLLVARKLAQWHRVSLPYDTTPKLFPTIRRWLANVPKSYSKPHDSELFAQNFDIAELLNEVDILHNHLAALHSPVTLCHADLLSANIIYQTKSNDVTFIDYEYGAYNYRGLDIANHFIEWGGFEGEWWRVPDADGMRGWLEEYWKAYNGRDPSDKELDAFATEIQKFKLASHFYWGVWALIQASVSDIAFDYMNYAKLRFDEYWKRRDEYLAL